MQFVVDSGPGPQRELVHKAQRPYFDRLLLIVAMDSASVATAESFERELDEVDVAVICLDSAEEAQAEGTLLNQLVQVCEQRFLCSVGGWVSNVFQRCSSCSTSHYSDTALRPPPP